MLSAPTVSHFTLSVGKTNVTFSSGTMRVGNISSHNATLLLLAVVVVLFVVSSVDMKIDGVGREKGKKTILCSTLGFFRTYRTAFSISVQILLTSRCRQHVGRS